VGVAIFGVTSRKIAEATFEACAIFSVQEPYLPGLWIPSLGTLLWFLTGLCVAKNT